ncbi:MAG TPA: YhbY family RNA-binding protein [Casimicrobiaceae bacterium]|nr:YhbY family RNA-binding protein [Casimicrobiaceae bacterium]
MPPLDPATRRALRARAHHLDAVVSIGHHGLTAPVLHEIDIALKAHELIKVRVFGDDRAAREAMLETICHAVEAAPVQHVGKLLVLWRPNPEAAKPASKPARKPRKGPGKPSEATRVGRKQPARPPRGRARPRSEPPRTGTPAAAGDARRRRGTSATSRDAPPAGVPRAALPRRRRERG